MSTYMYKAKMVATGESKRGEIEAATEDAARQKLQTNGLEVASIKEKPENDFAFKIPGTSGVGNRELIIFSRQLSTMIDAGLPIVQALDLLASQEQNVHFNTVADVFCGCGTVALEAKRRGTAFWGCDINPVAVLIAKAKTNTYNEDSLLYYIDLINIAFLSCFQKDLRCQLLSL